MKRCSLAAAQKFSSKRDDNLSSNNVVISFYRVDFSESWKCGFTALIHTEVLDLLSWNSVLDLIFTVLIQHLIFNVPQRMNPNDHDDLLTCI